MEGGRHIAELEKQAKEAVALKKADQSVDVSNNAKKAHVECLTRPKNPSGKLNILYSSVLM